MDVKRLTLYRYVLRTLMLAVPNGAIVGFIILTYTDNIIMGIIITGLLSGLSGVIISAKNYRQLIAPMKSVMEDLDKLAANSKIEGLDKLRTISDIKDAFNAIIKNLIGNLSEITQKVKKTSESLVNYSEQTSNGAINTASAISEVAASIQQISSNSQEITMSADKTSEYAQEGSRGLERITIQMDSIQKASAGNASVITGLNDVAQQISQIVEMITQIADQTNLLALNAAIEAARAGEQGKGFAVVADEVRNLAEQSGTAAKKIQELISITQQETHKAVLSTNESIAQIETGLQVVSEVSDTFSKIEDYVGGLAEEIQTVTASTEEMTAAISGVADTAEKQSQTMEKITFTAHNMNELSFILEELAERFDISKNKTDLAAAPVRHSHENIDATPAEVPVDGR